MPLTVSVSDDLAEQARRVAEATERSVASLVEEALARHLAAEQRRLAAQRVDALIGRSGIAPDADAVLRALRAEEERPGG